MKKTLLLIALFIMMFSYSSQAQGNQNRVVEYKKEYITQELQLTPDEAAKFFPIYDEYRAKLRDIRKSMKKEYNSSASVDDILDKQQDAVDLQKTYYDKFKTVIPEEKVVKLIAAEKKFNAILLNKLKSGK